ncbi:MAG: IPT/TIG domain-containing protein [Candidatus Kapabacteria bacterium]|jgi:sugar lactone lactonase YvrE|nr:IPT/TIG domain-containing protein [Candidatus Kapabacteria bacterium]
MRFFATKHRLGLLYSALLVNLLLCAVPTVWASSPTWKRFGALQQARHAFAAYPISSSRALVIGGYTGAASGTFSGSPTARCEIIDADARTITAGPSMNVPRAEFASVQMPDGSIVVVSGVNVAGGGLTNTVEVYNPSTQTWRNVGSVNIARRQHVVCALNADEILVVGGRLANLNSIAASEIVNIRTGVSRRVADFPYPINSGAAVQSSSGKPLFFGGRSGGGDSYRTTAMYEYDQATNQWLVFGNMTAAVQSVVAFKHSSGRFVLSGGTARESFTPFLGNRTVSIESANSVSVVAAMQIDRVWHSVAEWNADSIVTIGGLNNMNTSTSSVDWINLSNGQSTAAASLLTEHSHGQAVSLPGRDANGRVQPRILMISGFSAGYRENSSIEILDRSADSNSTAATAPRITSIEPLQASIGARITLRGRNFTGASRITFGGVPAASFIVQSDSVIIATLGQGASGVVRVTTPVGSIQAEGFVFTSPPVIASFSPARANVGGRIVIVGSGFIGARSVSIGGVAAEIFSVDSDSRITAVIAAGAVSGDVVVRADGGEARRSGFSLDVPPVITALRDTIATLGDTIRIHGQHFTGASDVRFGTTTASVRAISFRVVSDSLIVAVLGSGMSGGVVVTTLGGTVFYRGLRYIEQMTSLGQFGYGMYQPAVDSKGNLYISQEMRGVWKIEPSGKASMVLGTPNRLAGGIVIDSSDNVFIVDKETNGVVGTRIVKLTPAGVFTVIAESPLFQSIYGLVMDKDGNMYAVSYANHAIVKITQEGVVSYIYSGEPLNEPVGLNFDSNGDLLITNYKGAAIVRYSFCSGQADVVYDGRAINLPHGILVAQSGNMFIADHFGSKILKMTPEGTFEEFIGASAPFPRNISLLRPTGLALTKNGTFYVVDYQNGRIFSTPSIDEKPIDRSKMGSPLEIRSFVPTTGTVGQQVSIRGLGFSCGVSGVFFGGAPARSIRIVSDSLIIATVGTGATGEVRVATESSFAAMMLFTFTGTTSGTVVTPPNRVPPRILGFAPATVAVGARITITGVGFLGASSVRFGSSTASVAASSFTVLSDSVIIAVVANGTLSGSVFVTTPLGTARREGFRIPEAIRQLGQFGYGMYIPVIDSRGNIYITQELRGVWKISPDGTSRLVYRSAFPTGGITVDKQDNVYMCDEGGTSIVKISPSGVASLFCRSPLFKSVAGLEIDNEGNIYASAYETNSILKITPDGRTVTTVFRGAPLDGCIDLKFDAEGNLIVANYGNNALVKITPCGTASILYQTPAANTSPMHFPHGLTIARSGKIFVAGYRSGAVIQLPRNGGTPVQYASSAPSAVRNISLLEPLGVTISPEGWMVVVDYRNGNVWRVPDTGEEPLPREAILTTPAITSFTPTTGTVGQTLTIRGQRFSCGVSRVSVGGIPVREYTVVADSLIIATLGTGATGAVSITTPLGTASRERFVFATSSTMNPVSTTPTMTVTTPTVTAPTLTLVPPSILTFTPTQGTAGTIISIIGQGFIGVHSVMFGSATNATPAATFLVRSDSLIVATLGSGASGNVTVISTTGIATRPGFVFILPTPPISTTPTVVVVPPPTPADTTSMTLPPPSITTFAPSCTAGGNQLTVVGTGFTGRPEVRVGRLASANAPAQLVLANAIVVVSTTQILVTLPSGLSRFTGLPSGLRDFGVSVSTTTGTATRSGLQYVETPPTINAFSPSSATQGDRLFIVGQGFTCVSDVRVGGSTVANYQVVSDTLIVATLGATTSGTVRVTTPAGVVERGGFVYAVFPLSLLPSITSFAPTAARVGQTVTITGSNFSGVASNGAPFTTTFVSLGGVPLPFTVVSPTQITVRIPADFAPTNTDVRVMTPGGSVSAQGFTFIPEPVITSFGPTSASTGSVVLISGRNFTGTNAVQFGSVRAQSFTVLSDTLISAVVGDGASGDVRVTTQNGTATRSGFTFVIPPPFITSFTPTQFVASTTITITGRNFVGNGYTTQLVLIGNNPSTIISVNPTTLVVRAPLAIQSTTITVITPGGTANACCLTVPQTMMPSLPQPPRITGFSPPLASVGAVVTIRGEHFTNANDVRFGGVTAASFRVVSPTEIQATVGAGATGEITVRTSVGTAGFAGFTFITPPQPIITGFSPATGAAGDTVRVRGQHLLTVSSFTITGDPNITVNANFTTSGDTLVTAVLGAGQSFSLGTINLRTLGGTARATGFTFIAAPVITSFSPSIAGNGDAVVINGAGFDNVQSVAFGNSPNVVQAASFVVNSPSRITARLSTGATGSVVITTRGGTASREGFIFAPVPVITRFSPDSARAGESVRIVGSGFISQSAVSVVNFGGVRAASWTVVSDSVITAIPAQTGATGAITLTTPGGTATRNGFVFLAPLPTITSFTPQQASVGDIVTIIGTNLNGATSVSFGSRAAASFLVSSPTQIVARVGNGTSGTITVQTPGGRATAPNFVFIPAPPAITSFSPDSAAAGQTITLRGRDFSGVTAVRFTANGTTHTAQSFSVTNDSTMTARVPALGTNRVSASVSVQSPNGTGSRDGLQFVPAPTVSGFTPTSATAGTTVVITGTNFTGATAVRFGGTNARSFAVNSVTEIRAVVGAGASGAVSVVSYGGTGARDGFVFVEPQVVIPAPTIISFTPQEAAQNATVTITGTNFSGNGLSGITNVLFGGVPAQSYAIQSPTTITAVVGAGTSGAITVTSARGNATASGFRFIPAPIITDFTPKSAGRGAVISIVGRNLAGATSVSFGGTAVQFTVSGDTLIRATVQIGSTGAVSVTTPGGTATAQGFTFLSGVFAATNPAAANPKDGAVLTSVAAQSSMQAGLRVYPNPAQEMLTIEAASECASVQPLRFVVRNSIGAVVMTFDAQNPNSAFRKEINVGALPAGAYSVEMLCGAGERFVARFVRF